MKQEKEAAPSPSLKELVLIQTGITFALFAGGTVWHGLSLGASMAFGSGLMLLNVIGLGWIWSRLILKKSIAWTLPLIVIKYAVLLGSIFYLSRQEWFSSLGAGVGISSLIVAILVLAVLHRKDEA